MTIKNEHVNYKIGDGTIVSDMSFKQSGVGGIEIEQFNITYSTQKTGMFYHLRVFDGSGRKEGEGWGTCIFEGSLEDLVSLIRKSNKGGK